MKLDITDPPVLRPLPESIHPIAHPFARGCVYLRDEPGKLRAGQAASQNVQPALNPPAQIPRNRFPGTENEQITGGELGRIDFFTHNPGLLQLCAQLFVAGIPDLPYRRRRSVVKITERLRQRLFRLRILNRTG